ncbi:hypothetical protein EGW08_000109 [Elysia chlorotica]|uniref:F-box domain-containing protein n=1 Tax=Elysia chlorotica TaxID=188477 RepID=A0A433UE37_ELYCH|nr:hypothetical protein EGW08_000109 [Elysia chlorotica]
MAQSADDITKSTNIINEAIHHFNEVEKREGNVSPLAPGQIRLEGDTVTDFSSQYGSESSISYVAANLAGQLNIFPKYGDYTQACVLRTFGPWWKNVPSGKKAYQGTPSDFTSEDFLEIRFPHYLYPVRVEIYETYNPGAVVRILACDAAGGSDADQGKITWATLWSQEKPKPTKRRPRIFAPSLRKVNFATNLIRLELNSTCLEYYTELDGIKLVGTLTPPMDEIFKNLPQLCFDDELSEYETASETHKDQKQKLEAINSVLNKEPQDVTETKDSSFIIDQLESKIRNLDLESTEDSSDGHFFTYLPRELLQLILSYLDLKGLCNLALTCRLLRDHCYDPLLYVDLNLQPFWSKICGPHLTSIVSRCSRVQRLNLSWLGAAGHIDQNLFIRFLQDIGELQVLELSCCKFVNSSCLLDIVVTTRFKLTELNLSSCTKIEDFSVFTIHALPHLKRLNLYRTKIDCHSLISFLTQSPELEHLNIGSCVCLRSRANAVLAMIGSHCK